KKILEIKPGIGIAISVDGYGDMHEKIRGIPSAWDKNMDLVERLQKLGMKNLRLAFTILPENVQDFGKVYDEAKKRGLQFTHAFAQSSEHYFGGIHVENHPDIKVLQEQYSYVMNQELKSWNLKRWVRAYFAYGLYRFSMELKQVLTNDPGTKFFYLDPRGVMYPSVVHTYSMGNIQNHDTFDALWYGTRAKDARKKVETEGVAAWMICTARTAIKRHPLKVAAWVFKNKIFGVTL
ncbi:MAG: radical SAM protein, partial [Candidatus Magasanikbacteria bacterium]|nr:radical SAM protein [Candidatus Magasanikbacteria bacterium]